MTPIGGDVVEIDADHAPVAPRRPEKPTLEVVPSPVPAVAEAVVVAVAPGVIDPPPTKRNRFQLIALASLSVVLVGAILVDVLLVMHYR
jgi:hypothetical protein